eukprot:15169775-Ditylum_brightwellii.AAC.1
MQPDQLQGNTVGGKAPVGSRIVVCIQHLPPLAKTRVERIRGAHFEQRRCDTGQSPVYNFYALAVLPVILILDKLLATLLFSKTQRQGWFADNTALAGFYAAIEHWFARLCKLGPPCSYIPDPSKSILITHTQSIASATDYFEHYNFKIKAGNHYLGGFLGKKELAQEYAAEKVADWALFVDTFSDMMGQQPQAAFARFSRLLKCKWAYLQQLMEMTGDTFDPLEEAIHKCLLAALFEVPKAPQDLQDLAAFPVRHGRLGALNPTKEAPRNRTKSE